MTARRTICIEPVGALVRPVNGRSERSAGGWRRVRGSRRALLWLRAQGWTIVIHTSQSTMPSEDFKDLLRDLSIPFDEYDYEKPKARLYVQRDTINFYNWGATLEAIKKMHKPSPARRRYSERRA